MTISEVSKKYDISPDTLRYYERIGLLPPVPRNANGRREYDSASCGWIEMMKCLRKAGVQIEALTEYVDLRRQPGNKVKERRAILAAQREKLLERIEEMQASLELLDHKIAILDGEEPCLGRPEDGCLPQ